MNNNYPALRSIQNLLSVSHLVQDGKSIVLRWTLDRCNENRKHDIYKDLEISNKLVSNNHLKKDKEARRNHGFALTVKNHQRRSRSLYGLVRLGKETEEFPCSNGNIDLRIGLGFTREVPVQRESSAAKVSSARSARVEKVICLAEIRVW